MDGNNKLENFWLAVFSLVGTTIGAGIFSLPYVFFKSGFIIGFLEFIFLVAVVLSGFGVLLFYMLLAGRFLASLFNLDAFTGSIIFFVIWFLAILSKPRLFGGAELFFC